MAGAYPRNREAEPASLSGVRLREGVGGRRALRPEDERELPLRSQAALRGPEGSAGLVEVQRAKPPLHEEAVVAGHALAPRTGHLSEVPSSATRGSFEHPAMVRPPSPVAFSQIGSFSFSR